MYRRLKLQQKADSGSGGFKAPPAASTAVAVAASAQPAREEGLPTRPIYYLTSDEEGRPPTHAMWYFDGRWRVGKVADLCT